MPLLIPLTDVRLADEPLVGRKAAVLGELVAAGFPVPPGLCVTTDAFRLALADDLRPSADLVAALRDALPGLADQATPLAVRSSATLEDLADHSFAGEYTTVLGARGLDAVVEAVQAVWRSFGAGPNRPAPFPTRDGGEDAPPFLGVGLGVGFVAHPNPAMAVLIQPLIAAECAGVAFSVDPVRQRRDLVVVNAAWGQGVGVVAGAAPSDTYWLRRADLAVEAWQITEKDAAIELGGDGPRRVGVAEAKRLIPCLPDAWAERVAQYTLAAETALGWRQDMEWAIADGQVHILQSRPLTGLAADLAAVPLFRVAWDNSEDARRLWTRWEGDDGQPLLPLAEDALRVWEKSGDDGRHFAGHDWLYRGRYVNGHAYFANLPNPLPAGDRRVRRAALRDLQVRLAQQGITAWEHIGPEMVRATERLAAFDPATADNDALAEHLEDAIGVYRRHWSWHGPIMSADRTPFYTAYAALAGLDEAAAYQSGRALLDGEPTPLTRLIDELYGLALLARDQPRVTALVAAPPPDVCDQLARLQEAGPFLARLDAFLTVYGDRMGDGYGSQATLATPTWRERPDTVLRLAAPWLDPALEPPAVARARAQAERDAHLDALYAACPDPDLVLRVQREYAFARRDAAFLEQHNHTIDQLSLGQLRRAVLMAGQRLADQGQLAHAADVFWLRFEEVLAALRGEDLTSGLAEQRQAQHAAWASLEPPPFLGLPDHRLTPRPSAMPVAHAGHPLPTTHHLSGLGASPGRRAGRARVVSPDAILPSVAPGDVLVAANCGPRWTPLFPILGGLVLDEGSVGQHAAATAREYGVPAVIATREATRCIHDGDWVMVDGTAGVVELAATGQPFGG
ncbi:MAG: hypothetical protein KIT87_06600 [Anaerolineae bacterium]|nr:hypothetical protein [Anaerolineae bacterium]